MSPRIWSTLHICDYRSLLTYLLFFVAMSSLPVVPVPVMIAHTDTLGSSAPSDSAVHTGDHPMDVMEGFQLECSIAFLG